MFKTPGRQDATRQGSSSDPDFLNPALGVFGVLAFSSFRINPEAIRAAALVFGRRFRRAVAGRRREDAYDVHGPAARAVAENRRVEVAVEGGLQIAALQVQRTRRGELGQEAAAAGATDRPLGAHG